MIRNASRVAFEVQVEDRDEDLARLLRAVAKYDCAITDGIGTTFVVRVNLSHAKRFEADTRPRSMTYRAPVQYLFGRLVPLYSCPEDEVLSYVDASPGSN